MTLPDPIVAVHLRLASDQTGRAFLSSSRLARVSNDLASALEQRFVTEDDAARLSLLRDEIAAPVVTVETFAGEELPVAHYAYVRSTIRPGEPLFACVLAPRALVAHLVQDPTHVVFETATFQVIDHPSSAAFEAGLESWARRVFPGLVTPPSFRLASSR